MRHLLATAGITSAAAVLLAGCGGPAASPTAGTTVSTAVSTTSAPATADRSVEATAPVPGTLVLEQRGSTPASTLWYARIETPAAAVVVEQAYPAKSVRLSRSLPPGAYRIIVWHRRCTGSCPASGENGLGPLEQVCGARVTVVTGKRVNATVAISPDGTCQIATQPPAR